MSDNDPAMDGTDPRAVRSRAWLAVIVLPESDSVGKLTADEVSDVYAAAHTGELDFAVFALSDAGEAVEFARRAEEAS